MFLDGTTARDGGLVCTSRSGGKTVRLHIRDGYFAKGALFQPELIEIMRAVLDEAAMTLPEAKRTSAMKAEIASHILACAAKGERDPVALKMNALSAVVKCSHYSRCLSGAPGGLSRTMSLVH
jgi:hypothetical protein